MMESVAQHTESRSFGSSARLILLAGLAGAAIDGLFFSSKAVVAGKSPVNILQSIASFWLGTDSKDGGAASALLGLATHVGLATIMAAGFAALAARTSMFRGNPIRSGMMYGLLLYAVMYGAVLPLRWPTIYPRWDGGASVLDIGVHLVIGCVFALIFAPIREGSELRGAVSG